MAVCQTATVPPYIASHPAPCPAPHWSSRQPLHCESLEGRSMSGRDFCHPAAFCANVIFPKHGTAPYEVGEQLSQVLSHAWRGRGRSYAEQVYVIKASCCGQLAVSLPAGAGLNSFPFPCLFPADGTLDVSPHCLPSNLGGSGQCRGRRRGGRGPCVQTPAAPFISCVALARDAVSLQLLL